MAYKTACNYRPPCVALIVDDPTYDAGQNEAIVTRLAQPIRVSGDDEQVVGIQIVYGNVAEEVEKAEAKDKPLLVYSWVPRAEIMTPGRFVRITLESFYHCGAGESSSSINSDLTLHQRGVTACDYPIEHVEKAVVWRLQEPSSTTASLFVNAFNLNTAQLHDLLEIGDSLGVVRSSEPSATELDHIACLWLNDNTEVWEAWLPDVALYSTALYQWNEWLISCGVTFFLVFCAIAYFGPFKEYFKGKCEHLRAQMVKLGCRVLASCSCVDAVRLRRAVASSAVKTTNKPAELKTQAAKWRALLKKTPPAKEQKATQTTPTEGDPDHADQAKTKPPFFSEATLKHLDIDINVPHPKREPIFRYLSEARRCLLFREKVQSVALFSKDTLRCLDKQRCIQVVLFALGQIFVAASTGFIQVVLFERWLDTGLDKLSLEVTISCAVMMLTLKLIEWGIGLLPSCDKVVQKQLADQLLIKYQHLMESNGSVDLKSYPKVKDNDQDNDTDEETNLEDQFQQAIMSTASELANDCYLAALGVFSSLWVFIFSITYLLYRAFKQGNPGDQARNMIFAFLVTPVWLLISLAIIVPVVKRVVENGKHATATAFGGCMWITVYSLWAFGPILINPLKNDWTPGTNSVSKADLLTAST